MSEFTRRIKGLQEAFPASGVSLHEPGDLVDTVQLVHKVLGPLQRIGSNQRTRVSAAAAAGSTTLVITTAPENVVRVVEYCEAFHDGAAAHIRYELLPAGGSSVTIQSTVFEGAGAATSTAPFPLKNGIALAPGDTLRIQSPVGVGDILEFRAIFIDYTAAEEPFVR